MTVPVFVLQTTHQSRLINDKLLILKEFNETGAKYWHTTKCGVKLNILPSEEHVHYMYNIISSKKYE